LEYIPSNQCRNFRLVCRKWNEECCFALQTSKARTVTFSTVTDLVDYLEHFSRNPQLPQDFPSPHSHFHISKIRLHLIFDNYTIRKFFKTKGSSLKHLQLDFTGQSFRLKFLRVSIWNPLEHSQLHTLSLHFKDFHHLWPWALAADQPLNQLVSVKSLVLRGIGCDEVLLKPLIFKIMACLPNLTSIEMGDQSGKIVFDLIFGSQPALLLESLERLHFHSLYSSQISNIEKEKVRLKHLHATLHEKVVTQECQVLLDCQSLSLVTCSLESSHILFPSPSERFLRLTSVELKQFVCNIAVFSEELFPVLRRLKLISSELILPSDGSFKPVSCLQCITLESCIGLSSELIRGLSTIAPNLRRFDIPIPVFGCEDDLLKTVCEEMPHLEELFLSHDYITDESITGIPNALCKQLLEELKYGKKPLSRKDSLSVDSLRQGRKWIGDLLSTIVTIKLLKFSDYAGCA